MTSQRHPHAYLRVDPGPDHPFTTGPVPDLCDECGQGVEDHLLPVLRSKADEFVLAGAIAGTIAGAVAGAITGGLLGAIIGAIVGG